MRSIAILAMLFLAGCGATEATRRVNYLNGEAAGWIVEHTKEPGVVEAATNIKAGSVVLAAEIGEPDVKPEYSASAHKSEIEVAAREIQNKGNIIDGIWSFAQTAAGKVSALVGLGALGVTVVGWLRSASKSAKLWEYAKLAGSLLHNDPERHEEFVEQAKARGLEKSTAPVLAALEKQGLPVLPDPPPAPPKPDAG